MKKAEFINNYSMMFRSLRPMRGMRGHFSGRRGRGGNYTSLLTIINT